MDVNQLKMRFIEDVIGEKIVIYRNKRDKIIQSLVDNKYLKYIYNQASMIPMRSRKFVRDDSGQRSGNKEYFEERLLASDLAFNY